MYNKGGAKILNKKERAYDQAKELYFNFDWSQDNATINFVNELGAILVLPDLMEDDEKE